MFKNLLKSKVGGEKLLSLWWFFVLVVVGSGIVIGVLIYYNSEIDTRAVESEILAEKIVSCLVNQGEINENFLNNEEFDIFQECGLDKNILDSDIFYFNVSLYDFSGKSRRNGIYFGLRDFETQCKLEKSTKSLLKSSEYYPKCSEKQAYALSNSGENTEKLKLFVLAGSNQRIKKISIVK